MDNTVTPSFQQQQRRDQLLKRVEKRTYLHYMNQEYIAPELLPCKQSYAKLLASAIAQNNTLKSLAINGHCNDAYKSLFCENICDEEATHLAAGIVKLLNSNTKLWIALTSNTTITKIDLSKNRIQNDGASSIAQALCANKSVKSLNLSCNFIGETGMLQTFYSFI